MKIVLRKGTEIIEVEVDPASTLESLQCLIKSKFRIAPSLQKLTLQDEIVTPTQTLSPKESFSFYSILPNSTIYIESAMHMPFIRSQSTLNPLSSLSFSMQSASSTTLEQLIRSIKEGDMKAFNEIINKCSSAQVGSMKNEQILDVLNAYDDQKWAAVHYACFHKRSEILQALIDHGCDINSESLDHFLPIQLACMQNSLECLDVLLNAAGIQINKMTSKGAALHVACKNGNARIVEKLLEYGAHPSLEDPSGLSPILMAESLEILEMIPKYVGKELISKYSKANILPLSFSGMLFWSSPWRINESQVFLLLDTQNGYLYHYSKRSDFENNSAPYLSIRIKDIEEVRTSSEKIVEDKFFIILRTKLETHYYYTKYMDMTTAWKQTISDAVNFFHVSESQETKILFTKLGEDAKDSDEYNDEEVASSISIDSFRIIREVGVGSFGKVYEAMKKDTTERYALKVLSKSVLRRHKQLKYAIAECKILKEIHHPFIIPLHWAFQSQKNVYMVYEFCPYGDLTNVLKVRGRMNEMEARLYIAETILAIEYLHDLNIVYRDLKPLNILLDANGHVKLADFGLAKANVSKANPAMSFCGTPGYLAPELIKHSGAHKPVDIYAIGVTLFELICGVLPFANENINRLYKDISQGKVKFPYKCSKTVRSLIKSLMCTDPDKRPTIKQVKSHEFFEGVDWEELLQEKSPSQFKPANEFYLRFEIINEESEEISDVTAVFDVTMVEEKENF